MLKPTLTIIIVALAVTALSACMGPNNAPPTGSTPGATSTVIATAQATPATPPVAATVEPSPTATSPGSESTVTPYAPTATPGSVFTTVLGTVEAPPGWRAAPCQGDSWHFCYYEGDSEKAIGIVSFIDMWPLETLPDFQKALTNAGLQPGSIDYRNPEHEQKIRAALQTFVADYHTTFQEDRQITYGDTMKYTRLETQEIRMGSLPAVHYGFALLKQDGSTYERWLSYAAFDGELFYVVVASYSPDAVFTFRSDDDLKTAQPYLLKFTQGMKLPIPTLETDVKQVTALANTEIFRTWAVPSNPVGQLSVGQSATVTGVSLDRRWWQVVCPAKAFGSCWVSADTKVTQPASP